MVFLIISFLLTSLVSDCLYNSSNRMNNYSLAMWKVKTAQIKEVIIAINMQRIEGTKSNHLMKTRNRVKLALSQSWILNVSSYKKNSKKTQKMKAIVRLIIEDFKPYTPFWSFCLKQHQTGIRDTSNWNAKAAVGSIINSGSIRV